MKLTDEMRERIKEIAAKRDGFSHEYWFLPYNFYWFDDIPTKKLVNAIQSYGPKSSAANEEEAICLHDSTVFGSAKEGFLLTTKGIYYKQTLQNNEFTLPIKNIKCITIERETFDNYLHFVMYFMGSFNQRKQRFYSVGFVEKYLKKSEYEISLVEEQANQICNIWTEIINFIKNFSTTPEKDITTDEQEDYEADYAEAPPAGPLCPQCNTPIEEGEKFCSGCGAKVPEAQAETPQATSSKKVCTHCKKDLEPEWTVCPYCQTKVITIACKKCGKDLQEEWLVCPYCNTKVGPKLCANCGKELQEEWKVCPFCSTAVGE